LCAYCSPHSNDPGISKFAQPDTIIPNLYNPQSLNRYAYTLNNPIKYTDPSGHRPIIDEDENGNPILDPDWPPRANRNDKKDRWTDPDFWSEVSVNTQDTATVFSSTGAVIEILGTAAGCIVGSEAGVIPGCVAGYKAGYAFHYATTNKLESLFSFISFGATVRHDWLVYNTRFEPNKAVIGEASATAFSTWLPGQWISEGIIDAGLDIYASRYSHGIADGIFTKLQIRGKTIDILAPVPLPIPVPIFGKITTIQFGDP